MGDVWMMFGKKKREFAGGILNSDILNSDLAQIRNSALPNLKFRNFNFGNECEFGHL